jgi:hypothetical protein
MGESSFIPNSTQVHNIVLDVLLPFMREGERAVFLYLYRRTFGFNREEDSIGLEQFEHGIIAGGGKRLDYGCGMKRRVIIDALGFLIASGIVERVEGGVGRKHISRYRMKVKECPIVHTLEAMMERNAEPKEIAQILHQFRKVAKSAPINRDSQVNTDSYINSADNAPLINSADSAPKEAKKGARNDTKKVQKSNPQSIREIQKENTPPENANAFSSPNAQLETAALAEEIPSAPSPVDRFIAWFNTEVVPLTANAQSFNPDDLTPKLKAKINAALKAKSGRVFWCRVRDKVALSPWLRGLIPPKQGKRRFRMTLDWLVSCHYQKRTENYALIVQGEWDGDPERGDDGDVPRHAVSHDGVVL